MTVSALSIGKSDPIATALAQSSQIGALYIMSEHPNPGISKHAAGFHKGHTKNPAEVVEYAKRVRPDFAIIASEEPLANGVVDALRDIGVPSVGPTRNLARLESSKSFTRELLTKFNIPGNPNYRVFRDTSGIAEYLRSIGEFVVKPDGLTGGKGVKVFGDHLTSIDEALSYCSELFENRQPAVIVEEKLEGEEFSFQSFFDGKHIRHTIPVQDHKRALVGDTGPNTGGMGSYTCSDHLLPFLTKAHLEQAGEINRRVGEALVEDLGEAYKGILYGAFIITRDGLKVIEYNARFGDPEVMNVLSLLETDFVEICLGMINGTLDKVPIEFGRKATVCKYIVPAGYPGRLSKDADTSLDISAVLSSAEFGKKLRVYYGAVDENAGGLKMTDSRSIALVGVAETIQEAERIAESAARSVKGNVFHRGDIGTSSLIQKRVDHMNSLWSHDLRRRA